MKILVTGVNGQLGHDVIEVLTARGITCKGVDIADFDLTNQEAVSSYIRDYAPTAVIHCAAYTAVDKAESETKSAFAINAEAVGTLAKVCNTNNTQLIHISTDYVFDGTAKEPYKETDKTNPGGIYGKSKLQGEQLAIENCPSAIVIRTSWLYSSFNNNFVKTMLRLMTERESIDVVNDQYGSPTYAADLALAIMRLIKSGKSRNHPGLYHYSDAGVTSWYGFAVAIRDLSNSNCIINPITTAEYPTAAKRPAYSVLDTTKIKETFYTVDIRNWKDGLRSCLATL